MYSYEGLEKRLEERGLSRTALARKLGINFRTIAKISKDEKLSKIIKHLHYILKHDTKDASLPWFAVGDYS